MRKLLSTCLLVQETLFLSYHFAGVLLGESLVDKFPDGTAPFTVGEPGNVVTNYGYDIGTQMQSTKDGLCTIAKA